MFPHNNYYIIFCSPNQTKDDDDPVPLEFVRLVKSTMSKMVGAGVLTSTFMDLDFWTRFPRKMSACKAYLNRKKKVEIPKTAEDTEREQLFLDHLREYGITYRMRSARG